MTLKNRLRLGIRGRLYLLVALFGLGCVALAAILIWLQSQLQTQMKSVEDDIRNIEANANLSDTEKMFSMQMAMNTWSAISNLRTNMLKSVSDTLKTITRNVA